MTIKSRLFASTVLIAILPLVALSVLHYTRYRDDVTAKLLGHLESAAAIQQARVATIMAQNAERLALVSSRTQLRLSLASHLDSPSPEAQQRMHRILVDAMRSVEGFRAIQIHDLAGTVVASTDPERLGQQHPQPDLLTRAIAGPVVDHVYLDDAGRNRILLSGPMVLDDRLLGVVVIESRMTKLLTAVADVSGLGATGETVLARPAADNRFTFLAPTRFKPDATLQTFGLRDPEGADACGPFNGEQARQCLDYRDQEVLAAGSLVPGTDWVVVVKVDCAEAFADLSRTGQQTLVIVGILVILILVVTQRFAVHLGRPLEELAVAAHGMAGGELTQQVPVRSRDEVGVLASSFNTMAERVAEAHAGLEEKIAALNAENARRKQAEAERERLIGELTDAMAQIKTLAGIIPICASCKRIRDDRGYWNQLESYLSEHSDAHFTHGLCPDCFERCSRELADEADERP